MKILFSKPLTLRHGCFLPREFYPLTDEAKLSYEFGNKYPNSISEYLTRINIAMKIIRERRNYDLVITGRYGELFAAFQGVFKCFKRPHILLDIEWPNLHSNKFRCTLSTFIHRIIANGAAKIQVFCECEADSYASYFGIDRNKFVWIPYCTDLDYQAVEVKEENYIFAGGLHNRDYHTLFHAVKDLPIDICVAAPIDKIGSAFISKNMHLPGAINRDEFFTKMAKAKIIVLSLEPQKLRCPGVITYVTAMRLGKCVVVNDPNGAKSYIENGRTGLIVNAKDPSALEDAIRRVLSDEVMRKDIAANARTYAAKNFSSVRYFSYLEKLAHDLLKAPH